MHDRNISVATSSIDGLVCVVPLLPSTAPNPGQTSATVPYTKAEITIKNFKRPILAVALSPNFRADRMFLSGGLAGNLVLSVAPAQGASGWMALGMSGAKDTVLHSGEGAISAISWSRESPRYVAWTNEQGIKIMRSHIIPPTVQTQKTEDMTGNPGYTAWIPGLGAGGKPAGEVAWKRISAIERPDSVPEEVAGLHKPRMEWIDRRTLLTSEPGSQDAGSLNVEDIDWSDKEKLVVGWGHTVWVMDVYEGGEGQSKDRQAGWAELTQIFETDCIISGIHMYTPTLLLLLAYLTNDSEEPTSPTSERPGSSSSVKGKSPAAQTRRRRETALIPELRFIDLKTSEEVSADELMMNRFEGLAVGDYHLSVLPPTPSIVQPRTDQGAGYGAALWSAAVNPAQLFSSASSVRSQGSGSKLASIAGASSALRGPKEKATKELSGWGDSEKGTKIYITSPYDVVFATERSQSDHLQWLLSREKYQDAWCLIDKNPDVVDSDAAANLSLYDEEERKVVQDGYESDSQSSTAQHSVKRYSAAEKEKRRIGELWLESLINAGEWKLAGETCGRVLGTSTRWEHWVWVFEAAKKIEEITPYIPNTQLSPPLPSVIYEIVLAHYLRVDRERFRALLFDTWKTDGNRTLYDARTVADAITRTLNNREDEIKSSSADWKLLNESLAQIYMVLSEPRNALRRYIILQDADAAFDLIRTYRLLDAISSDILSLLLLRITPTQLTSASIPELESLTDEALDILIDEADKGIVPPTAVISQLHGSTHPLSNLFLFFYLRRLFASSPPSTNPHADLALSLFAEHDRPLFHRFLRESHAYSLAHATAICEERKFIPELVHLLSKTGQTKRALFLIIDQLRDVEQAIEFAKQQDDPDLWNDLLDYSMDKPPFIRGLLEHVGTAIDPITLVRRIPAGLEIEGLKKALQKILKEYGVQWSICDGVAKALRSEVGRGMDGLRLGQRRAMKFEVSEAPLPDLVKEHHLEMVVAEEDERERCGVCALAWAEKKGTLVAFACGHGFHLACIGGEEEEGDGDAGERMEVRTVAPKVDKAKLLRGKLAEGCVVCRKRRESEILV